MKSKRLIVFASILFVFSFLNIYLNSPVFNAFREKIYNSDFLIPFSLFQGFLNTSGRHDWVFSGVIPLFPDLLFGFIFWVLFRNMNIVLIAYAIFQPILILASFIYLSKQVFGKNNAIISLIIFVSTIPILLVATGKYWGLDYIFIWHMHCGIISLEIFALALIVKLMINNHQGKIVAGLNYSLLSVLIIISTTTDPLFFIHFSLPAISAIILLTFISACTKKNAVTLGLAIIISSIIGFLIYNFPTLWGGSRVALFSNYGKPLFTSIVHNFSIVLSQLSSLWSPHQWMILIWVLFYLICIVITIKFSRSWLSQKIGRTRRRILILSMFFFLQLIFLLGSTTITGHNANWYYLPIAFIPLFWGWSFLLPLINKWKAVVRDRHFVLYYQGAIMLVCIGLIISAASRNNSLVDISEYYPSWVACIDNNAQRYHLHHGIADYWQARTLTLESHAGLSVAQVSPNLTPFRWENRSDEYMGDDFDFVILDGNAESNFEIKLGTVTDRFGQPDGSFLCESDTVLIYNQPKDKRFREQFSYLASSSDLEKVGNKIIYFASQLPSQVGTISGDSRFANEITSKAGFLTFGPYLNIPAGEYQFKILYNALHNGDNSVGTWDVSFIQKTQIEILLKGDIQSGGESIQGSFRTQAPGMIEIRVYYNGMGTLGVDSLQIERIN